MTKSTSFALVMGALVVLPTSALGQARTFRIADDGGSRMSFTSDAPLETITGISSKVSGSISVDPTNLRTVSGQLIIPVSTIRTGVQLRDEHLRSNTWLDATAHPNITFDVVSVRGPTRLQPNREARLRITGRVTLHGVTKEVTAEARVKWMPLTDEMREPGITGDVIRARARFKIKLSDFNVQIPAIVRLKVADELEISVDVRAVGEPPPAAPAEAASMAPAPAGMGAAPAEGMAPAAMTPAADSMAPAAMAPAGDMAAAPAAMAPAPMAAAPAAMQ